jgi:mono/diheme cytochrome c family protein
MNQIDAFIAKGMLDAPLAKPYEAALVTPYPGQAGSPPASATLEERARSYLHANCANCHRPDADFFYQDLRFGVALKDMNICGLDPQKGNGGVQDAKILEPGKPMQSLLWIRMKSLENRTRMPQIGTYHVDEAGLTLIGDWITSIKSCPE